MLLLMKNLCVLTTTLFSENSTYLIFQFIYVQNMKGVKK